MNNYAFPLCIQLAGPDSLHDSAFAETLNQLQSLNFYGVELNITDFDSIKPQALKDYLDVYNLKMTMLATGAYAKKNGLSLSSPDEAIRKKTVDALCDILIPFAEKMGCDIICGFIKGDTQASDAQLEKSVAEVCERRNNTSVHIYLEATNHYESGVINMLSDGARLAHKPWYILPDTYHMNIEECSLFAPLEKYQDLYRNLHISDNNRYFPGYGSINFYQILLFLKAMNYQGTISIEGRTLGSLSENIEKSSQYIAQISSRIHV